MQKGTVIAGVCAASLLIGLVYLTTTKDHTPPVIRISDETLTYDVSSPQEDLLTGVSAQDAQDGDVAASLIIKNVYYFDNGEGTVVYAAKDSSNNVATAKRMFRYTGTPSVVLTGENVEETESVDEAKETENAEAEETEESETNDINYEKLRKQQISQNLPYIKLSVHQVDLNVGENFIVQHYIEEAWNQQEDADRHLQVKGEIDTTKAGTYELQVYVTDADGNASNIENLTVLVR